MVFMDVYDNLRKEPIATIATKLKYFTKRSKGRPPKIGPFYRDTSEVVQRERKKFVSNIFSRVDEVKFYWRGAEKRGDEINEDVSQAR